MPLGRFRANQQVCINGQTAFAGNDASDEFSLIEAALALSLLVQRHRNNNVRRKPRALFGERLGDEAAQSAAEMRLRFQKPYAGFERPCICAASARGEGERAA